MSIATDLSAPALSVQSSGSPNLDALIVLGLAASTTQILLFQTSIYLAFGGVPPKRAAVPGAGPETLIGFDPEVALLTPIAIPLKVTHCQKTSSGKVKAP